ncbi:hypothetical protein CHS0354_017046 [Potamilus streckersoni]|uniref:Uncharacterized protein n=1 Tax=Potamilus streckersoni TaxID=2493646 RepID=A0AAE0SZJ0_9BIVA|nr:hypothetical protein CHS0354_017046 [Potamilus streckersoni]
MQSGNIQIGDRSYDLRPAVTGDTPAKLLEVTDSMSRRYFLMDQAHLQEENLVENKDSYDVYETHVRWKHKTPFRPLSRQKKRNFYHLPDDMISARNPAYLQDIRTPDIFTENLRQLKQHYYVKVAVLSDSSIWDL